ncbi:conjugative transfer protein [Escherichia coli]|nr:conjugative transfer protein [Escherichia coli]
MEHGARLSTSRVMAIAFIFMSVLIVLSLSVNVIQGVNNYRLQNEQRTAVTPMAFNAPFAVSQNSADASYLQQMAGNDSNLLIVFYVQIMPDDFVMQLHRF